MGLIVAGLVIFWGVSKSDFATIPIWIQAGATLALLAITMMSTYATMVTAQANRDLAEATQKQLIEQTKERKSKIIKEIAQQVFQPIVSLFKSEKMAIESGYLCVLYSNDRKIRPSSYGFFILTPANYYKKQIYPPDPILKSRLDRIIELNKQYQAYAEKKNRVLEGIYLKQQGVLEQFGNYCLELKKDDDRLIIPQDTEAIFCQALANSNIPGYQGFDFVNTNRSRLISKIRDLGFTDEIDEYKLLKKEFLDINKEYLSLISAIFNEWKCEYYLSELEVDGSLSSLV